METNYLTKIRYGCDGLVDDKVRVPCTSFHISSSANNILSCYDLVLPNYYCLNSTKRKHFYSVFNTLVTDNYLLLGH